VFDSPARFRPSGRRHALTVVALGVVVAVAPLVLAPSPGGGPVGFAVRSMQAIVAVVGSGVAAAGAHSYRTGNLRPAVAAGTSLVAVAGVGAVGGSIEMAGGPLVPLWAWGVAGFLSVFGSVAVTNLAVDPGAVD